MMQPIIQSWFFQGLLKIRRVDWINPSGLGDLMTMAVPIKQHKYPLLFLVGALGNVVDKRQDSRRVNWEMALLLGMPSNFILLSIQLTSSIIFLLIN